MENSNERHSDHHIHLRLTPSSLTQDLTHLQVVTPSPQTGWTHTRLNPFPLTQQVQRTPFLPVDSQPQVGTLIPRGIIIPSETETTMGENLTQAGTRITTGTLQAEIVMGTTVSGTRTRLLDIHQEELPTQEITWTQNSLRTGVDTL